MACKLAHKRLKQRKVFTGTCGAKVPQVEPHTINRPENRTCPDLGKAVGLKTGEHKGKLAWLLDGSGADNEYIVWGLELGNLHLRVSRDDFVVKRKQPDNAECLEYLKAICSARYEIALRYK